MSLKPRAVCPTADSLSPLRVQQASQSCLTGEIDFPPDLLSSSSPQGGPSVSHVCPKSESWLPFSLGWCCLASCLLMSYSLRIFISLHEAGHTLAVLSETWLDKRPCKVVKPAKAFLDRKNSIGRNVHVTSWGPRTCEVDMR